MPRYKLTIAYDGTDFCGWQKQEPLLEHAEGTGSMKHVEESLEAGEPGRVALRTVQAVVEKAVREVVREPVILFGASRTDSGVHARGQVAAFTTTDDPAQLARGSGWPVERGTDPLLRALNGRLPDDVLVTAIEAVDAAFDPVGDCTGKGYSYTIHASRTRPLWDRRYVQQVWDVLDLSRMQEAAAVLVGEHDFAAFAAAGHGRQTTVRTVYSCSVSDATPPDLAAGTRLRIDISGNGFLWNMVRIVAGTLVEAGKGRLTCDDIREALRTGDRRKGGPTLPPAGLCLEWVRYT
ncbi:MAG: tRNA pseudouridine(38-40) synthase TruA [Phycisphaerales bacterium]|nr:tRNA pseudouridine(38-40) synthase TruA [Phycisphaerales bacterium]